MTLFRSNLLLYFFSQSFIPFDSQIRDQLGHFLDVFKLCTQACDVEIFQHRIGANIFQHFNHTFWIMKKKKGKKKRKDLQRKNKFSRHPKKSDWDNFWLGNQEHGLSISCNDGGSELSYSSSKKNNLQIVGR